MWRSRFLRLQQWGMITATSSQKGSPLFQNQVYSTLSCWLMTYPLARMKLWEHAQCGAVKNNPKLIQFLPARSWISLLSGSRERVPPTKGSPAPFWIWFLSQALHSDSFTYGQKLAVLSSKSQIPREMLCLPFSDSFLDAILPADTKLKECSDILISFSSMQAINIV